MATKLAYKLTGLVVLVVGILFFLRDIDPVNLNLIGNTSGWTIIIVLVGAAMLAGTADFGMSRFEKAVKKK